MASRRELRLRFSWSRSTLTAMLGGYLTFILLAAAPVHALDPNKHLSQYMHTAWRTQDASLPAGMFSITQTHDGFLWFLSLSGDVYRFDGVRFLPWRLPAGVSNGPIGEILADHEGGLWVVADELVHLKDGVVTSHFELKGLHGFQSISEDPDGSLWVGLRASDAPLCHVTDRAVKCFGKADGIPIFDVNSLLADGKAGFWLGGSTALVHWHGGVSETYPIGALKSSGGDIMGLAPFGCSTPASAFADDLFEPNRSERELDAFYGREKLYTSDSCRAPNANKEESSEFSGLSGQNIDISLK